MSEPHRIIFTTGASTVVDVPNTGQSREEATEQACSEVYVSLCHQCAKAVELGDFEPYEEKDPDGDTGTRAIVEPRTITDFGEFTHLPIGTVVAGTETGTVFERVDCGGWMRMGHNIPCYHYEVFEHDKAAVILRMGTVPEEASQTATVEQPDVLCILTAQCFKCQYTGEHRDPPAWHTWANDEDVAHCAATGQPDPSKSRCGCSCAVVSTEEPRDGE